MSSASRRPSLSKTRSFNKGIIFRSKKAGAIAALTMLLLTAVISTNALAADSGQSYFGQITANISGFFGLGTGSRSTNETAGPFAVSQVDFTPTTYTTAEVNAGFTTTVNVKVTRTGPGAATDTSQIDVATVFGSGTATAGSFCNPGNGVDYIAAANTFVFTPGNNTATLPVTICGDNLYEAPETFLVRLNNPQNTTQGSNNVATVTINDNDPLPTLTMTPAAAANEGSPVNFTVTQSAVTGATTTFVYKDSGGAAPGIATPAASPTPIPDVSDYQGTAGDLSQPAAQGICTVSGTGVTVDASVNPGFCTVTIAPGNTTAAISFPTFNDNVVEGPETFGVTIGTPLNANAALCSPAPSATCNTTATGTINDTTTPPTPTPTPTPVPTPTPLAVFDLTIAQAGQGQVAQGQTLTYTLTVTVTGPITPGLVGPAVRFNYPSGVPIIFNTASGTNGYTAAADPLGVTFSGGGIDTNGADPRTATLTVVVVPQTTGSLISAGANVVVDPTNLINETNETNNTAPTDIQTAVTFAPPTPTPFPTPAGAGFEGDINRSAVGVPGTGDGDVNVGDQIQYQKFLSGADCPAVGTNPTLNEQQRLDAGPRNTLGDGLFGSSDGTAIDAYARHDGSTDFNPNVAGWQPTPAGGPATISNLGCTPSAAPESSDVSSGTFVEPESTSAARVVRVVSRSGARNSDITVDIEMTAQGNEAGTQYGLQFDPTVLAISSISGVNVNPDVMLGAGAPEGTTLNVNADEAAIGRLGIVENFNGAAASITAIPAGTTRIARVRFHVLDNVTLGTSRIDFDNSVINGVTADVNGMILSANYEGGDVSVSASRGVTVSGRVTSSDGRGIRGATVTIVDGDGLTKTATTSAFGYYVFDEIPAGSSTISVTSRQYRFASRTVVIGDNLADVNFVGLE